MNSRLDITGFADDPSEHPRRQIRGAQAAAPGAGK